MDATRERERRDHQEFAMTRALADAVFELADELGCEQAAKLLLVLFLVESVARA